MARRVSLPSADDLFRPTAVPDEEPARKAVRAVPDRPEEPSDAPAQREDGPAKPAKKPSGRVRHDEKMTVYVTSEELLEIEHARLSLRRAQGLAVDRGRLVREAVALVLADYEAHGEDSALVRRLSE
ncbi:MULTISPECIES: hypothetical protein [unclassified Nocardioides]|uniref:hypothetical protein n=1 Tax=unclassified Nocardioides TaxID=2615069 RepID=UPI002666CE33|nr:hypothetical protein [Nocardioides sp. Arc9.136]WKN46708.1 hypothetical protein OSR43_11680 [Nocardioides sp. Arc9.136]